MTDAVISYDPGTDTVIYPSGNRYTRRSDPAGATAKALYEAKREVDNLLADKRFLSERLGLFPPATKRVPLHELIGERMAEQPDLRVSGFAVDMNATPQWWSQGTTSFPLEVSADGTVEVLA